MKHIVYYIALFITFIVLACSDTSETGLPCVRFDSTAALAGPGDSSITLAFKPSTTGKVYAAVLPASTEVPSFNDIKSATTNSANLAIEAAGVNQPQRLVIPIATENTTYPFVAKAYFYLKSSNSSDSKDDNDRNGSKRNDRKCTKSEDSGRSFLYSSGALPVIRVAELSTVSISSATDNDNIAKGIADIMTWTVSFSRKPNKNVDVQLTISNPEDVPSSEIPTTGLTGSDREAFTIARCGSWMSASGTDTPAALSSAPTLGTAFSVTLKKDHSSITLSCTPVAGGTASKYSAAQLTVSNKEKEPNYQVSTTASQNSVFAFFEQF